MIGGRISEALEMGMNCFMTPKPTIMVARFGLKRFSHDKTVMAQLTGIDMMKI
jgi:hypothetical protein|nr:MAG TPA: hypothetical protein [Caudoviricetes sp.]